MTNTRRLGFPALSALLLVGALASCSQSDKAGILLTVDTDTTVPDSPAITSLAVTANGTTKTFDVSTGLPGTLGIETSPGDKDIVVVGSAADSTPVASGKVTCSAAAGKVIACTVKLTPLGQDAGITSDGPNDTGGIPGFDGAAGGDAPTSTGGASDGSGGVVTSGGTTATGGVTAAGGTVSSGGATGGVPDAGGGAPGFDASSTIDAPPSTAGSAGGAGGATTAGGTMSSAGATSSGGTTTSGGKTSSGGVTTSGGLSNSGGGGATGGTASTGGTATSGGTTSTGGTTSSGGTISTGGTTKLVATAVAAGYGHSCALIKDGTVWCWGNNSDGELGDEDPNIDGTTTIMKTKPIQAKITSQAVSLATGAYHTCAVLADGTIQCFGYNGTGQIGNGDAGDYTRSIAPTSVLNADNSLLSNATSVAAGSTHTCALLSDKTVKCWGYNHEGQLGNGTNTSSTRPVQVLTSSSPSTPLTNVLVLALTHDHACAIRSGGGVYCWGDNGAGQLGNGNTDATTVAVQVKNITATAVGAGASHGCAVTATTVSPFNVQCWGDDFYGQLGDKSGTTRYAYTPVHALVLQNASAIALGRTHSCAVMVDSTVECWGDNDYGQLGNASTIRSDVPVSVSFSQRATGLGAGQFHTCAVVNSGAVYCWGDNYYGQMGNGTGGPNLESTLPVLVSGF